MACACVAPSIAVPAPPQSLAGGSVPLAVHPGRRHVGGEACGVSATLQLPGLFQGALKQACREFLHECGACSSCSDAMSSALHMGGFTVPAGSMQQRLRSILWAGILIPLATSCSRTLSCSPGTHMILLIPPHPWQALCCCTSCCSSWASRPSSRPPCTCCASWCAGAPRRSW